MATRRAPAARTTRSVALTLLQDDAHYTELVQRTLSDSKVSIWISTANVKELRIEAPIGSRARARGRYVSILELFESLVKRGVEIRLLHAGVPSRAFTNELAKRRGLRAARFEMRRCPRVHMKIIAVDGAALYLGSANFTGAGLGAKTAGKRNFELGVLTDDDVLMDAVQERFDRIWTGAECGACKLRALCPAPLDALERPPSPGPRASDEAQSLPRRRDRPSGRVPSSRRKKA